jgi:hypothetical protein
MGKRKFKVVCLAVSGVRNAIHRSGDVVFENNFPEGNAEKLLKSKHIQEIFDEVGADDAPKLSKKELIPLLTDLDAIFDESMSVSELREIYAACR